MDTYWRGNFDETGTIIMGASKHGTVRQRQLALVLLQQWRSSRPICINSCRKGARTKALDMKSQCTSCSHSVINNRFHFNP